MKSMTGTDPRQWGIGDVARRTVVTERTLRYDEGLGLLAPARDAGGRRRYDSGTLDRLQRVRLLRELGTPVADVNPDADHLRELTRRHLADLDARLADLARVRERVRSVEDRLLDGDRPGDEALLDLLSGLPADEPALTRRITLLVYRDIADGHAYLVDVLGLAPGPMSYDGERAVPARYTPAMGWSGCTGRPPSTGWSRLRPSGTVTASLAILVDDVDAHHARVAATDYEPTDMPYGVREYSVRDPEGHLWSFQTPLAETDEQETP